MTLEELEQLKKKLAQAKETETSHGEGTERSVYEIKSKRPPAEYVISRDIDCVGRNKKQVVKLTKDEGGKKVVTLFSPTGTYDDPEWLVGAIQALMNEAA